MSIEKEFLDVAEALILKEELDTTCRDDCSFPLDTRIEMFMVEVYLGGCPYNFTSLGTISMTGISCRAIRIDGVSSMLQSLDFRGKQVKLSKLSANLVHRLTLRYY